MAVLTTAEDIAGRFAPYIEELHELFAMHGVRYGAAEDLPSLAERLEERGGLANDLSSILRSIILREGGSLPHVELLEILTVAAGGLDFDPTAPEIQPAMRKLLAFVGAIVRRPWNVPPGGDEEESHSSQPKGSARVRVIDRGVDFGRSNQNGRSPEESDRPRDIWANPGPLQNGWHGSDAPHAVSAALARAAGESAWLAAEEVVDAGGAASIDGGAPLILTPESLGEPSVLVPDVAARVADEARLEADRQAEVEHHAEPIEFAESPRYAEPARYAEPPAFHVAEEYAAVEVAEEYGAVEPEPLPEAEPEPAEMPEVEPVGLVEDPARIELEPPVEETEELHAETKEPHAEAVELRATEQPRAAEEPQAPVEPRATEELLAMAEPQAAAEVHQVEPQAAAESSEAGVLELPFAGEAIRGEAVNEAEPEVHEAKAQLDAAAVEPVPAAPEPKAAPQPVAPTAQAVASAQPVVPVVQPLARGRADLETERESEHELRIDEESGADADHESDSDTDSIPPMPMPPASTESSTALWIGAICAVALVVGISIYTRSVLKDEGDVVSAPTVAASTASTQPAPQVSAPAVPAPNGGQQPSHQTAAQPAAPQPAPQQAATQPSQPVAPKKYVPHLTYYGPDGKPLPPSQKPSAAVYSQNPNAPNSHPQNPNGQTAQRTPLRPQGVTQQASAQPAPVVRATPPAVAAAAPPANQAAAPAEAPARPPATATPYGARSTSPAAATEAANIPPPRRELAPLPRTGNSLLVPSGVMASHVVYAPPPDYPVLARMTNQHGPVVLQALISPEGQVIATHVVSGHRVLRGAAVAAVKRWRYRPYMTDGHAVNVATTITVDFK